MSNWKYEGYKLTKYGGRIKLQLHTNGWSGNEDIIRALECARFGLMLFHVKWETGGHYWFDFPLSLYNAENMHKWCKEEAKRHDERFQVVKGVKK